MKSNPSKISPHLTRVWFDWSETISYVFLKEVAKRFRNKELCNKAQHDIDELLITE